MEGRGCRYARQRMEGRGCGYARQKVGNTQGRDCERV